MLTEHEATKLAAIHAKASERIEQSKPVPKGLLLGVQRAHCIECTYDPLKEGSTRQQVDRCPVASCPTHPVRMVAFK